VLALPHGAHLEKLGNLETLRRYAAKNAKSWYEYVKGPKRGRQLVNGALYLVTGCEKAASWGMASFNEMSPNAEFQLAFRATSDADSGYRYRWLRGPARQKHADPSLVPGTPPNQTMFIHAYTISLGEGIWGKIFRDVAISQLVDQQQMPKFENGPAPFGSQNSSSSWPFSPFVTLGQSANGRQHVVGHTQAVLGDAAPIPKVRNLLVNNQLTKPGPLLQMINPSQVINNHILREVCMI
jgi:hypothetical protein